MLVSICLASEMETRTLRSLTRGQPLMQMKILELRLQIGHCDLSELQVTSSASAFEVQASASLATTLMARKGRNPRLKALEALMRQRS